MNDRMTPLSFADMMNWILTEKDAIFGVRTPYHAKEGNALSLFGETLEVPLGPAAGPHTQLAHNIVAAYVAGARFFELKTVQTLDGEDLPVEKPCILAEDECYNVEWSTELRVPDAMAEYIKAFFALKLISKEFGLGNPDGFIFNMSVGYDLQGIQSEKIDSYIEGMRGAQSTAAWQECLAWARANVQRFEHLDSRYIDAISPQVSRSITLSTLHGCPPDEIERIATYLITQKGLHTFIKCNPTLLGYEFARKRMDEMGYDYVVFDDHHFKNDLQYEDAVPMFLRLQGLADERNLAFGVKLTNTFPVKIAAGELPGEEMYMSGRALFALSSALAAKLSHTFGGKLRISYSGGADAFNVGSLIDAGIWPVTVATTLLKPGGYQRLLQMADGLSAKPYKPFDGVDVDAIQKIAEDAKADTHYTKPLKALPARKSNETVPLRDCFNAPCSGGCPITQDIPEYIRLAGAGDYLGALKVITADNPLPFMTGTICNHRCQGKCRRNFYEETVRIRDVKLLAAEKAKDALLAETKAPQKRGPKVAVIGGGAAGMAAAAFLARGGMDVTIFEKRNALGGVVRHVIPPFRIGDDAIDGDVALLKALGVDFRFGQEIRDLQPLRDAGYRYQIVAIGAEKRGQLALEGANCINAIDFLESFRKDPAAMPLGKQVVVIGGGNTAMDTARAATRVPGVQKVSLVYRRDVRNMPADEEELALAQADGVCFEALLSPKAHREGQLACEIMALGEPDASGRRKPEPTGGLIDLPADTVIAAIGEKVDMALQEAMGFDALTFVIGDGRNGPATVVEAIADARVAADAILAAEGLPVVQVESPHAHHHDHHHDHAEGEPCDCHHHVHTPTTQAIIDARRMAAGIQTPDGSAARKKKGWLMRSYKVETENNRCLECDAVCECCVDVCPNRANVSLLVRGKPQIVHIDRLCNACGNCEAFCPYDSAPYMDKFTLFSTVEDYEQSDSDGMVVLDRTARQVRIRCSENMNDVVSAILDEYAYLL